MVRKILIDLRDWDFLTLQVIYIFFTIISK